MKRQFLVVFLVGDLRAAVMVVQKVRWEA